VNTAAAATTALALTAATITPRGGVRPASLWMRPTITGTSTMALTHAKRAPSVAHSSPKDTWMW
jgi:hypothetical protein